MNAPAGRGVRLILLEKDHGGPTEMQVGASLFVALGENAQIRMGKSSEAHVRFTGAPSMGRQVVELRWTDEGPVVVDLGSGGGSTLVVNGVGEDRPRERVLITGCQLWLGRVKFAVTVEPG